MLKTINPFKKIICIMLSICFLFSLTGCTSNAEMTEENITKTVEKSVIALQKFDKKRLEKYIDSQTLNYIISLSKGHEQFDKLGEAIFRNLEVEIEEIDTQNSTVTLTIKNKDLHKIAKDFTTDLLEQHSRLALVGLLTNNNFLDKSLTRLTGEISAQSKVKVSKSIVVKVEENKNHLTLVLDEDAEKAFSGGALTAVKDVIEK